MGFVSPNAIAPLQMLLEIAFFPHIAIEKAHALAEVEQAETRDASSQRALLWTHLFYDWAMDDGQVPISEAVKATRKPVKLDLTNFYQALADVQAIVDLEFSFPLQPSGVNGPIPREKWAGKRFRPMKAPKDQRLHLVERSGWMTVDFRSVQGISIEDEPGDLTDIPVFGQPSLDLGSNTHVGEVWVRITERAFRVLKRDLVNTVATLAILGHARKSRLREILHHQQPVLTNKQVAVVNRYLGNTWNDTLDYVVTGVRRKIQQKSDQNKVAQRVINGFHERTETDTKGSKSRQTAFISYSHRDEKWLNKVLTMLAPLVRNQAVTVWHDRKIKPSDRWRQEITNALKSASVGVLLVTDNFLASDFIIDNELRFLLDAAKNKGVRLLWVCVSHCLYGETELKNVQAVNQPDRPLDSFRGSNQKKELKRLCEAVRDAFVIAQNLVNTPESPKR